MSQKRRRKKNRAAGITVFITTIIVLIAAVLLFFKIETIEVEGAGRYTEEEILTASGVKAGHNLALLRGSSVSEKIRTELPYIGEVSVEKSFPSTLRLVIEESYSAAYVTVQGQRWLVSDGCRVIEPINGTPTGKPELRGLDIEKAEQGEILAVAEDDDFALEYAGEVLAAMRKYGIIERVAWLDVTNISTITFEYDGRFTVNMGSGADADYKLQKLTSVEGGLEPGETGRIDLSREGEVRVIPNN